jgi:glycosyltransferase involved in cell wall biosynthesis
VAGADTQPAHLTVGYELTGLELDAAGSARAMRGLRSALEERSDVTVVPLAHPRRTRLRLGRIARGLSRELLYFPVVLPRRAGRLSLDLLHCPMPLAPLRARTPLVVTVHDMAVWDHPEWFERPIVLQQRLILARALRRARRILTPSQSTRQRLLDVLEVDANGVDVAPWGVDERFSPGPPSGRILESLGVDGPYVLAVGTLEPRKNVEAGLEAFERLVRDGAEHQLVVAGARGWREDELVARLRASPASARVLVLGRVGEQHLLALYRGADCLVYPSRYEGFGFPPLEAMACGTPVVCARTTSLPEVVGDSAILFELEDRDALHDALADLLASPALREDLAGRGPARAARFTWERCAELTVRAYRHAAGDGV